MDQVVLITARDCYPYEEAILDKFEKNDTVDVYKECIATLNLPLPEGSTELDKQGKIWILFEDEKAQWTQLEEVFSKYQKEGVPLLKKTYGSVKFYVLPCTGNNLYLGDSETKLRQEYTSKCIDLICQIEKIKRRDIYAIIHSRDTGCVSLGMDSHLVRSGEIEKGAPLKDIGDIGHLYLFHHTANHPIYDQIVTKVCLGNENIEMKLILSFFPNQKEGNNGWWNILSELNNKPY